MSRHTPGPWDFEGFWRSRCGRANVVAEGIDKPGRIGFVYSDRARFCVGEAEANGHLFAAAPDLLAACKELADIADKAHAAGMCGQPSIDRARAAIAKAEGGKP